MLMNILGKNCDFWNLFVNQEELRGACDSTHELLNLVFDFIFLLKTKFSIFNQV